MSIGQNWDTKGIDIGRIREGKVKIVEYKGTPILPEISEISADCGCTKLTWIAEKKTLSVQFKAGKIPRQVQGNIQHFSKRIFVSFKDGSADILLLTGTKVR